MPERLSQDIMRKPYLIKNVIPRVVDGKAGYTGTCTHCGKPATKEAYFRDNGVIIIERYCDGCIMDTVRFNQIQTFYSRF
jgi:hypothetical protein